MLLLLCDLLRGREKSAIRPEITRYAKNNTSQLEEPEPKLEPEENGDEDEEDEEFVES
jgi:hypothetical protein